VLLRVLLEPLVPRGHREGYTGSSLNYQRWPDSGSTYERPEPEGRTQHPDQEDNPRHFRHLLVGEDAFLMLSPRSLSKRIPHPPVTMIHPNRTRRKSSGLTKRYATTRISTQAATPRTGMAHRMILSIVSSPPLSAIIHRHQYIVK